jgi:predicted transcriptional regulator
MSKHETFSDFMASQPEFRHRLLQILKRSGFNINDAAKEMGISPITLKSFLVDEINITHSALSKIFVYIEKKEKDMGLVYSK